VFGEMYTSWPRRKFLTLIFLDTKLVMAMAMTGERTQCCLANRVREHHSCLVGCNIVYEDNANTSFKKIKK
jgi:hypothetical protein